MVRVVKNRAKILLLCWPGVLQERTLKRMNEEFSYSTCRAASIDKAQDLKVEDKAIIVQAFTISGISDTLTGDFDPNLGVIAYGFGDSKNMSKAVDAVKGNPEFPEKPSGLNKIFQEEKVQAEKVEV